MPDIFQPTAAFDAAGLSCALTVGGAFQHIL
jgi:hypothetical protein